MRYRKPVTPKERNEFVSKAIKKLQAECKKQKVTLYADCTDDQGRIVYRIKEHPTFKATFNAPELEF